MNFDVIIVGAGVIGAAVARELSKYDLAIVILEKNLQVAEETSAGNSGVIHGGYDPTPGTLNARLNLLGRKVYETEWFRDLEFPHRKVDSLVVAFDAWEDRELSILYDQGIANGLDPDQLMMLDRDQCLELEPKLNPEVAGGLLCTCSHVVDPISLTNRLIENAVMNGAKIFLHHRVVAIARKAGRFVVTADDGLAARTFVADFVVNAAGHYADVIAEMVGDRQFTLTARRGQYRILERTESHTINNHILFMVPTVHGKGVIVAPMLDGHLLIGPTAEDGVAKEDTRLVTMEKFDEIGVIGKRIIPSLRLEKTCGVFSGSRSICVETEDFWIAPSRNEPRFINVAGISSPGLSAAPAIAREVIGLINGQKKLIRRLGFKKKQPTILPFGQD